MKLGRPKPATTVSNEQRDQVEQWARRRSTAQALGRRASIILFSIEGINDVEIAKRLRTTRETVGRSSASMQQLYCVGKTYNSRLEAQTTQNKYS